VTRSRLAAAVLVLLALFLAGLVAWRSLPGAGAGSVLLVPHRAVAGPARVVTAPWVPRIVLATPAPFAIETEAATGEGASWPLRVEGSLALDAARIEPGTVDEILAAGSIVAWLRARLEDALPAALGDLSTRELLAAPARLAPPLRRELAARLPAGIGVERLATFLVTRPEEARAAALAAVREKVRDPVARVLYVGLDAADWEIIDEMVARGDLPTFRRLQREGVRADLLSYDPMMSPILWTTALTGRTPDAHGVCDFTMNGPGGEREPISSRARKVPAIWEILGTMGQASGFVAFWATHPAEQVRGVLVADTAKGMMADPDTRPPLPAGTEWPPGFIEEHWEELWRADTVPAAAVRVYAPRLTDPLIERGRRWWTDPAFKKEWKARRKKGGRRMPPEAFLVKLAAENHNLEVLTRALLARPDLGVVGVYFEAIDMVGHNFQHLAPPPLPGAPPAEVRLYGDVVENTYRQQDAMLGRLLEAAGPGTVVIVHSDHGFLWGPRRRTDMLPYTTGQPVEWHRHEGMFAAWGGPVRRGVRVPPVTLYDITPTILALRGLPPGKDMPGKVRADLFDPATRDRLPPGRIPSWDPLVPPRTWAEMGDEDLARVREEMLEQLRGLGYIGDTGSDARKPVAPAAGPAGGEQSPRVTYWRNLATWYMNQDRFADAERALLAANRVRKLPKTYWLLSEARAARGDLAGAIAALEEGFRELPDKMTPEAVRWLVELHLRQGDVAAAERALENHRELVARDGATRETILGRIAEARGDREGARKHYLAALREDPRQARAAERYAALAATPEDRAVLLPLLRRGVRQDPKIELYWKMIGLILTEQGDVAGAAEAFHRAAELDPGDDRLRVNEAIALLRAGREPEAAAVLEELAQRKTRIPAAWINLGLVRARAGDWKGALAAFEEARRLGARSPVVEKGIAEARRRLGR